MKTKIRYDNELLSNLKKLGLISLGALAASIPPYFQKLDDNKVYRFVNNAPMVNKLVLDPRATIEDFIRGEGLPVTDSLLHHYRDRYNKLNPDTSLPNQVLIDLNRDGYTGTLNGHRDIKTNLRV